MKLKTAVVCLAALFSAATSQAATSTSFMLSNLGSTDGILSTVDTYTYQIDSLSSAKFSGDWSWTEGLGLVTQGLTIEFIGKTAGNVNFSFDLLGNYDDSAPFFGSSAGIPSLNFVYPDGIETNQITGTGSFGSSVLSWITFSGTELSPIAITSLQVTPVPEPSAALMFGLGLTALLAARRRKSL